MKDTLPVCAKCEYMTMYRCRETGNNRYIGGPRAACMCNHTEAFSTFRRVCPRSPKMEGFIGYTKPGGNRPVIKTSPKWCPRRKENRNEESKD